MKLFFIWLFGLMCGSCICDNTKNLLVVVLMVKNEEAAMQSTLQPFLDAEIDNYLILDTGSSDNTIPITRNLFASHGISNGHIVEQPFIDFATSRNYALQCAEARFPQAQFLLMIDAEWITHSVPELYTFCANHVTDTCDAYGINILMHKNNSQHTLYTLIRAHKNVRYSGVVHEAVVVNTVGKVPNSVYFELLPTHYGEEKSKNRWERDRDLLLQEHYNDPCNPRVLFYLGQTYAALNDYENACAYYKKRCSLVTPNKEEDFVSHYRLGLLYDVLDNWQQAEYYYIKAYSMRPTRAEPLVWLASHYLKTQHYSLSFLCARLAAQIPYPQEDILFIENDIYAYTRYDILGQVAGYLEEYEIGEAATCQALANKPEAPHLQSNLDLYQAIKKNREVIPCTTKSF